jgi:pimeloyl-ACP methyl ester carboxylesterase
MNHLQVADGVRLYVEDFGDGPPIVLVCGGNLTHKSWESQVAGLAGEFRTVTFDWRGTGASDKPRGGYTGEIAAADLRAVIERLGLAPAVIVGHGLGAHLALLVAYAAPDLVRGLLLASAAPWFSGERDGMAGGVTEEFLRFMISQRRGRGAGIEVPYAQICYELGENWVFHRPQSPGVYQAMLDQALEWPQYVLNAYAESMRAIDHRPHLPSLRCPIVIVQGRHDRKQRYEGAVHMARMIPRARLATFENSATMANIEEVDAFNRIVAEFARELQTGRKAAA